MSFPTQANIFRYLKNLEMPFVRSWAWFLLQSWCNTMRSLCCHYEKYLKTWLKVWSPVHVPRLKFYHYLVFCLLSKNCNFHQDVTDFLHYLNCMCFSDPFLAMWKSPYLLLNLLSLCLLNSVRAARTMLIAAKWHNKGTGRTVAEVY